MRTDGAIPGHGRPPADRLIAVVVGAHPDAEWDDRPIAELVRDELNRMIGPAGAGGPRAMVMTDLWFLNDGLLNERPAVSIGSPERNALTASLADRVPSAYAIDGRLIVQLDVEVPGPAACWGVDAAATAESARVFLERYAARFLGLGPGRATA